MRSIAIVLLFVNVAVLVWAFNTRLRTPPTPPLERAAGPQPLKLLSELPALPAERVSTSATPEPEAPVDVDSATVTPPESEILATGDADTQLVAENAPVPEPDRTGTEAPAGADTETDATDLAPVSESATPASEPAAEPTSVADQSPASAVSPGVEAGETTATDATGEQAAPGSAEPGSALGAEAPEPGTIPIESDSVCRRFGPFDKGPSADAFQRYLAGQGVAHHRHVGNGPVRTLFWVYLEPTTAEQARSTLADLERQGVKDYLLIKREDLTRAISLGVFSSQDSVNRRLAEMTDRGYQPIVVPRHETTRTHWIDVAAADAATIETHAQTAGVTAPGAPLDCTQIARAGP